MTSKKYIQGIINNLGYLEDGVYNREPDYFQSVRDIIKALHYDAGSKIVRQTCMGSNIVKNDLVPVMADENSPDDIFDAALRLTANLCQPTHMVLAESRLNDADDKISLYKQVESGLLRNLTAFNNVKFFIVLQKKLKYFFDLEPEARNEKMKILVERIIVLIQYVLAIGYDTANFVIVRDIDYRARESVISALIKSGIPDLFIKAIASNTAKDFSLNFLSIFSLIVKPFDASKVAAVDENAEKEILAKEKEERQRQVASSLAHLVNQKPARSSRSFLGGIYEMKNMKTIQEGKRFIVNKAIENNQPLSTLANRKANNPTAKNKRVSNVQENTLQTNTDVNFQTNTLREVKDLCFKLVEGGYRRLMKYSKDMAFMSNRTQTHMKAEIDYFSLVEFITEFARVAKIPPEKISQTFCKLFFHHVLTQLDTYFDMIKTDKDSAKLYALKAQHAVSAYKQMIFYLNYLGSVDTESAREVYESICQCIFDIQEYRELGYGIMTKVSPSSITRKALEDLVLMNHCYIHIMERNVKQGRLAKVHKRKKVAKKKSKKAGDEDDEGLPIEMVEAKAFTKKYKEAELQEIWTAISDDLSTLIFDYKMPAEPLPVIDYILGGIDEQNQGFAFLKVQRALRERRLSDAMCLFRTARSLWTDGSFGTDGMDADKEFEELKEVFHTDLGELVTQYTALVEKAFPPEPPARDENADDEEDEKQRKHELAEIEFKLDDYIKMFARSDVISWYVFLLKNYKNNSITINKAILKLFHRIAFDLNSPSWLYNATFFRILQAIHADIGKLPKAAQRTHVHFELYQFGAHLLTKFFLHLEQRGPILINEVLFPKTSKECYEIEHGYGSLEAEREQSKAERQSKKRKKGKRDSIDPEDHDAIDPEDRDVVTPEPVDLDRGTPAPEERDSITPDFDYRPAVRAEEEERGLSSPEPSENRPAVSNAASKSTRRIVVSSDSEEEVESAARESEDRNVAATEADERLISSDDEDDEVSSFPQKRKAQPIIYSDDENEELSDGEPSAKRLRASP